MNPGRNTFFSGVVTCCLLEIKDGVKYVLSGNNMKMYPEYF